MASAEQIYQVAILYPADRHPSVYADAHRLPEHEFLDRWLPDPTLARRQSQPALSHSTARHEAAHATAILHFGGEISRVEVNPDGGGQCFYARGLSPGQEESVALAGAVGTGASLSSPGCRSDRADLIEARRAGMAAQRAPWRLPVEMADADLALDHFGDYEWLENLLFSTHRQFFDALTAMLVERGSVGGPEVHALWDSMRQG